VITVTLRSRPIALIANVALCFNETALKGINKILVPLLFFIVLNATMKNSIMLLLYEYQTDLFVELFCENKSRPQLHCNGKCKMAKLYKEQQEEEAEHMIRELQQAPIYILPISISRIPTAHFFERPRAKRYLPPRHLYHFLFSAKADQPPEFA
jgi:hypothetical protein